MNIRKYSSTDFYPHHLTTEQIENPYSVINEIFDKSDLPELRESLWKWLKSAATGNYIKDLDKNERSDIFFTYETIEKLLEAAHIIYVNENTDDRPTTSEANEDSMEDMIILQPGLPAVRA